MGAVSRGADAGRRDLGGADTTVLTAVARTGTQQCAGEREGLLGGGVGAGERDGGAGALRVRAAR